MKAIAFNASPRKNGNTATLLSKALEGAADANAQTAMVHLYDYSFKGCISCLSCKLQAGRSYGRCAVRDELTPLLEQAAEADLLLLGSPVYLGAETGICRAFMERLIYPYHTYAVEPSTLFPRRIRTALFFTTGKPAKDHGDAGYNALFERGRHFMNRALGPCEVFIYDDARLFADPSGYFCPAMDTAKKQRHHEEIFPRECARAFELGKTLAGALS